MSGRGVITSRTTVSVKSTTDWSSSRPSSSEMLPSSATGSGAPGAAACEPLPAPPGDSLRSRRCPMTPMRIERQRAQQPGQRVEHRQQHVEHAFGVRPHDQHRHQVLARRDECPKRDDEGDVCPHTVDVAGPRDEHGGQNRADADGDPQRDEQPHRVVEILSERVVPAAALGHQAQRQPHQGAERRLQGAQQDRRARHEEERQRCHGRGPRECVVRGRRRDRSINPFSRPPLRRRRASARAIRPSSVSWSYPIGAGGRAGPGPSAPSPPGARRPWPDAARRLPQSRCRPGRRARRPGTTGRRWSCGRGGTAR